MDLLARRIRHLSTPAHQALLRQSLRGIERETLRVDLSGHLALTDHPAALGAALTHPEITTDYSESLLEFITPALPQVDDVFQALSAVHRHVAGVLGSSEVMWTHSMPACLPAEEDIPIARYGCSHLGQLKHVYRRGLAVRYGRRMQCIAGVHYNYSVAPGLWALLNEGGPAGGRSLKQQQSDGYLALIRNFRRHSWLLMMLFGASPAVTRCFLRGREHGLDALSADTLYLPYATSLRMSDLGYQNDAQAELRVPCDTLDHYVQTLVQAVQQPHAAYERIGTHCDGEWIQMNTHVLQIENEYYATIRPKRVTERGERPLEALHERGIQYVEVRCLDIDPFEPLGIGADCARMVDIFLLYGILNDSPMCTEASLSEQQANFAATVREGRRPGLMLHRAGQPVLLQDWGLELLDRMQAVAQWLDDSAGGTAYRKALAAQVEKLQDLDRTPSARVLAAIWSSGGSFQGWALSQATAHAQALQSEPPAVEEQAAFLVLARASVQEQQLLESEDQGTFDDFMAAYLARVPQLGQPSTL